MKRCRYCLTQNDSRRKKCAACDRTLPKPRRPKHLAALKLGMDAFVAANDGYEGCWVCRELGITMAGKPQRDHWHNGPKAGMPRGVLCPFHNRSLGPRYTLELVAALYGYLRRAA